MRKLLSIIAIMLPGWAFAQVEGEVALAKEVLAGLQPASFAKSREYCGYIGYNNEAKLVATDPVPGTMASCNAPLPRDIAVTSSYHTHGNFDVGYFNEVPSDIDMQSDRQFYMNGFVATPGGRFWFINSQIMTAIIICDAGCLPVAPGFYKGSDGDIAQQYTFEELLRKLRE